MDLLGIFYRVEKGPCLSWEKEWGSITTERYSERIVPLIHGLVSLRPDLMIMRGNAPCYLAAQTRRELRVRNTFPIEWPPFSLDLNPIEHVWNLMKNYIQDKYPDVIEGRQRTGQELRIIVKEAWDNAVNEGDLRKLVESMPQRVKAVHDAGGGHVKY